MIDFRKFNHIISLTTYFNTEEKCKQAIIESRWTDGDVVCPYCGGYHCVKRTKSMRTPHTQGRSTKTKTPVFGMMERSAIIKANGEIENITNILAFVVENTNKATLQPIIQQLVIVAQESSLMN